ncbi:MIP family Ig-specific serine endopeptidase [Mycoplasma corogypsi]|uniref:MIP family Ig-specific serine endopeptidase n=1 Tax=Mycoplasma corogypsi TaxID=2106 RepID=UPI003873A26F
MKSSKFIKILLTFSGISTIPLSVLSCNEDKIIAKEHKNTENTSKEVIVDNKNTNKPSENKTETNSEATNITNNNQNTEFNELKEKYLALIQEFSRYSDVSEQLISQLNTYKASFDQINQSKDFEKLKLLVINLTSLLVKVKVNFDFRIVAPQLNEKLKVLNKFKLDTRKLSSKYIDKINQQIKNIEDLLNDINSTKEQAQTIIHNTSSLIDQIEEFINSQDNTESQTDSHTNNEPEVEPNTNPSNTNENIENNSNLGTNTNQDKEETETENDTTNNTPVETNPTVEPNINNNHNNSANNISVAQLNTYANNVYISFTNQNVTFNELENQDLFNHLNIINVPENTTLVDKTFTKDNYYFTVSFKLADKNNTSVKSELRTINLYPKLSESEVNSYYANNTSLNKYAETDIPKDLLLANNNEYLQKILARSFSLRWAFKDGTWTGGTAWLLDYHKISNDKYSLYLATNYHVAVDLYSKKDQEIYYQDKRVDSNPILDFSFSFDVTKNSTINAKAKRHGHRSNYAYRRLKPNNLPELIFLGQNFTKSQINNEGKNYYSDFAVIKWDVDLSKQLTKDDISYNKETDSRVIDQQLKSENVEWALMADHIREAIEELDNSYSRFVGPNKQYWMNNGKLPYASLPITSLSIAREKYFGDDRENAIKNTPYNGFPNTVKNIDELSGYVSKYLSNYKYTYLNNVYFTGFSLIDGASPVVKSNVENSIVNDQGFSNAVFHTPFLLPVYGYNNLPIANHGTTFNLNNKSYYYGAALWSRAVLNGRGGMSGSLVVDQQNLPIAIYWGNEAPTSIRDDSGKSHTVYTHLFAPFSQEVPYVANGLLIDAYNLIDGTDKTKYPNQIHSYRERLKALHPNETYITKLFKDGV